MKTLMKYKVIKTRSQYDEYCNILLILLESNSPNEDEIELLTLLIENYDNQHSIRSDMDPIPFLKYLMETNGLIAKDLQGILGLSKGTISKILNYQSGLSKESIRILSNHFKVDQSAFNKSYQLADAS